MALFTKIYGELSLRIQQSLRRCNNRGAFQAHAGAPERQEASRLRERSERSVCQDGLGEFRRHAQLPTLFSYCKACPELFHRREPFPCPQRGRLEASIECHRVSRQAPIKALLFRE